MFENQQYSFSVDIWGLGIILYELYHKKSPFKDNNAFKIYKNIVTKPVIFDSDCPPSLKKLIKTILKIDPQERPNLVEILNDPFLKEKP